MRPPRVLALFLVLALISDSASAAHPSNLPSPRRSTAAACRVTETEALANTATSAWRAGWSYGRRRLPHLLETVVRGTVQAGSVAGLLWLANHQVGGVAPQPPIADLIRKELQTRDGAWQLALSLGMTLILIGIAAAITLYECSEPFRRRADGWRRIRPPTEPRVEPTRQASLEQSTDPGGLELRRPPPTPRRRPPIGSRLRLWLMLAAAYGHLVILPLADQVMLRLSGFGLAPALPPGEERNGRSPGWRLKARALWIGFAAAWFRYRRRQQRPHLKQSRAYSGAA